MKKNYRQKLTDQEYNAILKLTSHLKVDSVFDIYDCNETDKFKDWEENRMIDLYTGLSWLHDCMVYTLNHDGMTQEESKLIVELLKEFNVIKSQEEANYYLSTEEDK